MTGLITIDTYRLKELILNSGPNGSMVHESRALACVFLLLFNRPAPHILAIQKADTEGYPWRNQVALPGGHMERTDGSPVAAVFRELEEELYISKDQVDLIGSLGYFQTLTRPRDIEAFLGLWKGNGPVHFDATEIARIIEIPLKSLIQTHRDQNYHERMPAVEDLEYPFEDVIVWGATARILHRFIELIYPLFENNDVNRVWHQY